MLHLKKIFLLIAILISVLVANNKESALLTKSFVYQDFNSLTLETIERLKLFKPYNKAKLNAGVTDANIWIKFILKNPTAITKKEALVIKSHRLENITLYSSNYKILDYKSISNRRDFYNTLYPFFQIEVPPFSEKLLYLKLSSSWSPIVFSLASQKLKEYYLADKKEQIIKIFFLGIIVALMLYSFVLFIFTKDRSYIFYSFYLLTVTIQQLGYMGFLQAYLPTELVEFEKKLALPKVGLMLISTSLFAIYFLKTWTIKVIHRVYLALIFIGVLEILLIFLANYIDLSVVFAIAKIFVLINLLASVFNFVAAIIYYYKGNKEARFYILGFGVLLIVYFIWTLETLGISNFIYEHPNTIIIGTTIEALILAIAFADRYILLQKAKESVDKKILQEAKEREEIITKEVKNKTIQLKEALDNKALLLKELHHRVKNNLQIILSIVRLQKNKLENNTLKRNFLNLENRINAIARSYDKLLIKENLEEINMKEYINSLIYDIKTSTLNKNSDIDINTNINAKLPLKISTYIGLIINELITNAYKYAFMDNKGVIDISLLEKNGKMELIFKDNGIGFNIKEKKQNSLGLKFIETLVVNQLKGVVNISTKFGTTFTINFENIRI